MFKQENRSGVSFRGQGVVSLLAVQVNHLCSLRASSELLLWGVDVG